MKIHKLFLFFSIPFIGCCSTSKKDNSYKETMSIINEYSNIIKKKNKVRLSGHGLFYTGEDKVYDGKIHVIGLGYHIEKNFKYEEARKYFYSIVDGLIDYINENKQLEKYFFHYPVDYSDLEIDFAFWDYNESHLKRDDVHSIHIGQNKIYYEIVNEEGPNEIKQDQVIPNVYTIQGMLERNRSIIRTIPEDLAMHSKEQ